MSSKQLSYAIFFSLSAAIFVYFIYSGGPITNASDSIAGNIDGQDNVDGRDGGRNGNNGGGAGGSIFDTDLFSKGGPDQALTDDSSGGGDGEPEILDPTDKSNPKNPQTRKPYANSTMKQFSVLRKKFPKNSIIPRKRSPEEREKLRQERKELSEIRRSMNKNEASPDSINKYYNSREKGVKDRIELLSYVVDKFSGKMGEQAIERYKKILDTNKRTLENLKSQREKALEKSEDQ